MWRSLALITVLVLMAGCAASTPTPSTSPSPTSTPAATSTGPAPASSAPNAGPSVAPTPHPTATPTPTEPGPRWEETKLPARIVAGEPVVLADGRVLLIGTETAALWSPATGKWTPTAGFNKPRSGFTAIRLADGRVLVAGGLNDAGKSFSSAYAFDPRPGHETWDKVGLMTQARTAPSIAELPDGRILVAGGYFAVEQDWGFAAPGALTDIAIVRPDGAVAAALAAFTPSPADVEAPLADVEAPPIGHALATAEIFDPATGDWSKTGSMTYARAGAEAVTLTDGRVLVAGAAPYEVGLDWQTYGSAEIFDPETGRFSTAGNLPGTGGDGQSPGTLVALDDGGAVLVGYSEWWKHEGEGTWSFRFVAESGTWHQIGTPWIATFNDPDRADQTSPGNRWINATVVGLADGRVLIAGGDGIGMETGDRPVSRAARLYDPATDTWVKLPNLPTARAGGQGVLMADGSVLVVGGRTVARFIPGP